ncbi:AfsA-related hotdog domain-containing protein [Salmonella enterica]
MSFTESADADFSVVAGSYNYQSTIPKSRVHRAAVGEFFLTDIKKVNEKKYITAGYLPKSHIYFNDLITKYSDSKVYDAILLLEICRQSSIYVTHNFFDVPYSAKFVFDDVDFILLENEIQYQDTCSNVIIEVDIIERKYRKMVLTGLIFQMDIYVDGNLCAQKKMNISWMDVQNMVPTA